MDKKIVEANNSWEKDKLKENLSDGSDKPKKFTTLSGLEIAPFYCPEDIKGMNYLRDLGFPGLFPFTRGVQPSMYRGKLWTMRQFSGFGTAEDTNKRLHFLLKQGQTGLSIAFDLPTLMGYDSDHPRSRGEVGIEGVSVDTLADMEALFEGIALDQVSTSMTINAPAIVLLAMYIAVAEKQNAPIKKLRGTLQNDILKEFIAQKEWICPPKPSMRIITDMIAYCSKHLPHWNSISISGYHIREAGSTAVQELAFTLADGIGYVEAGIKAELDVDVFAPRLSFFFNVHNDFFEEIAKFRAARRMWSKIMRERFKAKDPRSWKLRTHAQTSGCSLTAQQPYNNIIRVTLQALAAILGGTQSLHTNSMDEVLALPTEEAVTIALRTQQIIAEESGVANTIDPLGGSYFIETLTNRMEEEAFKYIEKIDQMGGIIAAIEKGYPQREIADAAHAYQKALDRGERIIVGVNEYNTGKEFPLNTLKIDPEVEKRQIHRLIGVKEMRDKNKVKKNLEAIKKAAIDGSNLVFPVLEAVKNYAALGEICDVFREVFGEYTETPFI